MHVPGACLRPSPQRQHSSLQLLKARTSAGDLINEAEEKVVSSQRTLACASYTSGCSHQDFRAPIAPLGVLAAGSHVNVDGYLLDVLKAFLFEPASHLVGECSSRPGTCTDHPGSDGRNGIFKGCAAAHGGAHVLLAELDPAAWLDLGNTMSVTTCSDLSTHLCV